MVFIILGREYDWPISVDREHEYWLPKEDRNRSTERNFCFRCRGELHVTENLNGWLNDCLEISRKIIRLSLGKIFAISLLPLALEVLLLSLSIS